MRRVVLGVWIIWCFLIVGFLIAPSWQFHVAGYVLVSATLVYIGFPTVVARFAPDEEESDETEEPATKLTSVPLGSRAAYPRRGSWSDGR
jgi:hypothetical protein